MKDLHHLHRMAGLGRGRRIVQALGALAVFALPMASALAAPRYTTLFDEYVGNDKQASSSAEVALIGKLAAAGITFIDEAQSRKIRSVTDAGTLIGGQISEVITALDADVIVAAICRVNRLESELLGPGVYRYDATVEAKAIAVDNGQVLAAFRVQAQAMDFIEPQAATKAAAAAGEKLAAELLAMKARPGAAQRVEVTIEAIPNVTAGEAVIKGVEALAGVSGVEVLQAGRGFSKLAVTTSSSARELALALDAAGGLGLSVYGYTQRAVKAAWVPEAAMHVPLMVAPLDAAGAPARQRWLGKALAGVVGTSLSNLPYLALPAGPEARNIGGGPAAWKKAAVAAGVSDGNALVLTGAVRREGDGLHVEARVVASATGAVVLAEQGKCATDDASDCAAALGDRLAEGLLPALMKKRHLFKEQLKAAPARSAAAGAVSKPLEVVSVELSNIFPARLAAYQTEPIGTVEVKNIGKERLDSLVLRTSIAGFTASELDSEPVSLEAGSSLKLPVRVVLSREALVGHEDNAPAVVSMGFEYRAGEFAVSQSRSQAVVIYDRNSLTWSEPLSVAAFVTPRSPKVVEMARVAAAVARGEGMKGDPRALPLAIFTSMGLHGLSYAPDPVNPYSQEAMDYVEFPEQTLSGRSGDCDDLAVLFAAVGEAVGLSVALVTTPEHVFVAVDTGLPPHNASRLGAEAGQAIAHGGRLWLPVETTLVGKEFEVAWRDAAKEYRRWEDKGEARLVVVRDAWAKYPPVSLAGEVSGVASVSEAELAQAQQAAWARLLESQAAAREARRTELEAAVKAGRGGADSVTALARLMAEAGQTEQARELLLGLLADAKQAPRGHNDLGNLAMERGDAKDALEAYEKAIALDGSDARILINAALAAFSLGDMTAFDEYLFACLELGAEGEVQALASSGMVQAAGTRGADSAGRSARDLSDAVQQAFERAKRPLPEAMRARPSVKASEAGTEAAPAVSALLHWI